MMTESGARRIALSVSEAHIVAQREHARVIRHALFARNWFEMNDAALNPVALQVQF
ncbi:MAG TPA: hypothetical protein VNK23_13610 [Candidatus Dormibacteraeota bacterium]|nr:hypothetical protein [Candidatus Dormibacteraeota bacterium]